MQSTWSSATLRSKSMLAAWGLSESWKTDPDRAGDFLCPRLYHYAWREPILLLGGMSGQEYQGRERFGQDDMSDVVRRLLGLNNKLRRAPGVRTLMRTTFLSRGPSHYDGALHRDLFLAATLLAEKASMDRNLSEEIVLRLTWLVHRHKKKRVLTLSAAYPLGLGALFFAGEIISFWLALVAVFLWTLLWCLSFVGIFPRIQGYLAFPLRLWNCVPEPSVAIDSLGEIGNEEAVIPLIAALKDRDEGMRWTAAEALGLSVGKRDKLDQSKSAARALWWKLTGLHYVSGAAFRAFGQVVDRLTMLEVNTLKIEDPLTPPSSKIRPWWIRSYKIILLGFAAFVLILIGFLSSSLQEQLKEYVPNSIIIIVLLLIISLLIYQIIAYLINSTFQVFPRSRPAYKLPLRLA